MAKCLYIIGWLGMIILATACKLNEDDVSYDVVVLNARVIDPESRLDSILNVGIKGDRIAIITGKAVSGKTEIDGTGKVLSPGFIDLHAHGKSNVENSFQAYDGVTSALELEVGVDTIAPWLKSREGKALLNYGASACYLSYRNKLLRNNIPSKGIMADLGDSVSRQALPAKHFKALQEMLKISLEQGAVGVGIPVGYLPYASVEEIATVYAFAGEQGVPVFSHVREGGAIAFQQAIADAILNNCALHICHINSMARKDILFCLELIEKAQNLGYNITTELYPYTAGNTDIASAVFDDGWQERLGCTYKDLQWVATGERLSPESFAKFRKQGGAIIVHMLEEEWIDSAIVNPVTMIASDGGEYSPLGHPRGAGTFSKVLRKYVREKEMLSLPDAIEKMTLMPARVLEKVVPEMKLRARIQKGCYADLILFDANVVRDNATYEKGFVKSSGMDFVWVNGVAIIENGLLLPDVFPGIAIKSEN